AEIDRRIREELNLMRAHRPPATAAEMLAAEAAHMEGARRIADLCAAEDVLVAHLDPQLRAEACREARERMRAGGGPLKVEDGGRRDRSNPSCRTGGVLLTRAG
ncbi:MAG: hypothetical protein QME96_14640, partial [Myxococcota bacterium]|nr:hypothetical protein [Myxococcota bacterium]